MGVKAAARRTFAAFRCTGCTQIFAGMIPAIFEDLPRCPDCQDEAVIEYVLVDHCCGWGVDRCDEAA